MGTLADTNIAAASAARAHVRALGASVSALPNMLPVERCVLETVEVSRIDALEPSPQPGRQTVGPVRPLPQPRDDRLCTEVYPAGARVLRASLQGDHPEMPVTNAAGPDADFTSVALPSATTFAPPRLHGHPGSGGTRRASVRGRGAASPRLRGRQRMEIRRVEGFGAWEVVSAKQVRADRAQYGEGRVSIGYIVAVLTCKFDPAGGEREPGVLSKFRVTAADKADASSPVITHFSCAGEISNRLISAVAEAIDAEEDSVDIDGAYLSTFTGSPSRCSSAGVACSCAS